jgi:hypothetical protein
MYSYMGSSVTNVLLALVAGLLLLCSEEPADAAVAVLRCTNRVSGATWDMQIDFQNGTANSFPATFTDESIDWHDVVRGGHYAFDRLSGGLTVIYASSTGGFSLKHKCRLTR